MQAENASANLVDRRVYINRFTSRAIGMNVRTNTYACVFNGNRPNLRRSGEVKANLTQTAYHQSHSAPSYMHKPLKREIQSNRKEKEILKFYQN